VRIVGGILTGLFLIAATLFVSGCGDPQTNEFPGYMEAHLVLVGSEQGGRIETLSVEEGDSVEKDAPIFTLESTEQEAEVAAAKARVTEAEARLADAKQQMQRPGEIDVLEAALAQAKAMLVQSNLTLDRTQKLFDKHWVSQAQLDDAQAQHDRNEAAVAEAEKRIAAAKLPNRSDLIDAAAASVEKAQSPFEITLQRRYNPEGLTQLNIVPGLLGVVLTMTMMMYTALAVTREIERGTMENLLSMPIKPVEIMIGKIAPFVLVGFVQMTIILVAARYLFGVPIMGSVALLVLLSTLFAASNLAAGYTFSTIAQNQLQAVQMTFFFFLPNFLLSGFAFPFRGMPQWAQAIGEALPLTHFIRIVRGIMLKGNGFADMRLDVAALAIFMVAAMGLALFRFRRTLD